MVRKKEEKARRALGGRKVRLEGREIFGEREGYWMGPHCTYIILHVADGFVLLGEQGPTLRRGRLDLRSGL